MDAPSVYVRDWMLCCFYSPVSTPNLSEGADRVGGQLRGDKECPSNGVRNQFWQSLDLEEGVGERCWECVSHTDPNHLIVRQICVLFIDNKDSVFWSLCSESSTVM